MGQDQMPYLLATTPDWRQVDSGDTCAPQEDALWFDFQVGHLSVWSLDVSHPPVLHSMSGFK